MGSTGRTPARRVVPPLAATACAALAGLGGCAGDGPTVSIRNEDPAGKIPAMKIAAQRKDQSAVPALVAALQSDDPAERLYAIGALRRITGQTLDYSYYGSDAEREAGVGRWKAWLAARPPGPPANRK